MIQWFQKSIFQNQFFPAKAVSYTLPCTIVAQMIFLCCTVCMKMAELPHLPCRNMVMPQDARHKSKMSFQGQKTGIASASDVNAVQSQPTETISATGASLADCAKNQRDEYVANVCGWDLLNDEAICQLCRKCRALWENILTPT